MLDTSKSLFKISRIPLIFLSNIPYPYNFLSKYPVILKPLMGPPQCLVHKVFYSPSVLRVTTNLSVKSFKTVYLNTQYKLS